MVFLWFSHVFLGKLSIFPGVSHGFWNAKRTQNEVHAPGGATSATLATQIGGPGIMVNGVTLPKPVNYHNYHMDVGQNGRPRGPQMLV